MSKWIDADAMKEWLDEYLSVFKKYDKSEVKGFVEHQPSIDIVFCKECKWSKANGTYQWCGRLDSTARITADDFCSYGERSSDDSGETDSRAMADKDMGRCFA